MSRSITFVRNKIGEHQILILKTNPSKTESCTKSKENDSELIGKVEGSIWWIFRTRFLAANGQKRWSLKFRLEKLSIGVKESIGALAIIQVNLSGWTAYC